MPESHEQRYQSAADPPAKLRLQRMTLQMEISFRTPYEPSEKQRCSQAGSVFYRKITNEQHLPKRA